MSLDIHFISYFDDRAVPFPIDIVVSAFGKYADRSDEKRWRLTFPDGGWSDLWVGEDAEPSLLAFNRPALSPELSEGIFDIMKKTLGFLVCGGAGTCVIDPLIISHISFIDAVSPVYVVDGPMGIRARIAQALGIQARYVEYVGKRINGPHP